MPLVRPALLMSDALPLDSDVFTFILEKFPPIYALHPPLSHSRRTSPNPTKTSVIILRLTTDLPADLCRPLLLYRPYCVLVHHYSYCSSPFACRPSTILVFALH
jgi:hypothetical protein